MSMNTNRLFHTRIITQNHFGGYGVRAAQFIVVELDEDCEGGVCPVR